MGRRGSFSALVFTYRSPTVGFLTQATCFYYFSGTNQGSTIELLPNGGLHTEAHAPDVSKHDWHWPSSSYSDINDSI